jgi:nitrite reductase (NADH) small subunit
MKSLVGPLSDFPNGCHVIVELANRSIGIFNIDGELFAVRNHCPHRGAPICLGSLGGTMTPSPPDEYIFEGSGRILRCPWHGWEFDIATGAAAYGISRKRLVTYAVEVRDDHVSIDI